MFLSILSKDLQGENYSKSVAMCVFGVFRVTDTDFNCLERLQAQLAELQVQTQMFLK